MGIEDEARPVWIGLCSADEVGDRDRVSLDDRLILTCQRAGGVGMRAAVDDDLETACCDPRGHVHLDIEDLGADLGEPEVVLLDEVEPESVAPWGARGDDGDRDLRALAGRDGCGKANRAPSQTIALPWRSSQW